MPQTPRFLAPAGYEPDEGEATCAFHHPGAQAGLPERTYLSGLRERLAAAGRDDPVRAVAGRHRQPPDAGALPAVSRHRQRLHLQIPRTSNSSSIRRASSGRRRSRSSPRRADIVEKFGGEVPRTIEELTSLRGVARKTANVVMANCWPRPESKHGIFVDTHIRRVSQRLGWTPNEDPVKIEQDLMELLPKTAWVDVPHQLIMLGRGPCDAQRPDHANCPLLKWCPTGQAALAEGPPAPKTRRAAGATPRARARTAPSKRTAGGTSTARPRST